jgi:hypothetical protein
MRSMLIVLRRRNIEANLINSGLLLVRTSSTPRDRPLSHVAGSDLDDFSSILRFAYVAHAAGYYAAAIDDDRGKIERLAVDMGIDLEWLPGIASRDVAVPVDSDAA